MADPALVEMVKGIVASARAGDLSTAYARYRELFEGAAFRTYDPKDQRLALRMMIRAVRVPEPPTPAMVAAHQAAIEPLRDLVARFAEPGDQELLGICLVATGDERTAGEVFRAALATERARNVQSDLCGALMKRISML